jgi:hypothetical protein
MRFFFYIYLLPHFSGVAFTLPSPLLSLFSFEFQQSRTGEYRSKRALRRPEKWNIRAVLLISSTRPTSFDKENKHKHSGFYKFI